MEGFDTYKLLAEEIGEEAARRVFELFAGATVNFPKRVTTFFRDREIMNRFQLGEGYEALAREYHLSPQQIRNITSRARRRETNAIQMNLFD